MININIKPAKYQHVSIVMVMLALSSKRLCRASEQEVLNVHVSLVCFYFQPGVCHPTMLCVVPSEEVSESCKFNREEEG